MFSGRTDRLWIIGGVLAAAVLLVAGWFLLISPEKAEADRLHGDAETAQAQVATLRSRLADLERENADLPRYRSELAEARKALPATADSEKFLEQLQQAGEAAGVFLQGVNVGEPAKLEGDDAVMHHLPVAVTVTGGAAETEEFLDQIQRVQPRAVLVESITLGGGNDEDTEGGGALSTVVNLQIFVAPPDGAKPAPAAASPTADGSGS
ncbi:type 4a pilus biogenesis protein PilO [Planomonospora sp. ID91781]|uniref:type 4a pilus biogenesis protein PilO n=1 Tax=Planomonospora sp. ID91781 TaxID=2738135 RepID=UPI0018C40AFB|nr:type 4a pilus biogenesis protein PilO [Planomonospora sp. ID91781]MBG0821113.1 type 4a pilus biogenesis protein PilO [Planomonospora sp. ID91781]